ncbi:dromaiocalcin-1-like [Lathamus discolor]|uniref:dromaiocalcin-1-like n=1 Tax=Lathamus discolor TaxID=678569 RepID=UPI0032B73EF4
MGPAALLGLCLIGCLVLSPRLQGVQAGPCPREWLSLGGHCYGYFGQELSWRRAEAWCKAARGGGHLASLHTPEEHRALAAFISRSQHQQRHRHQHPQREEEDDDDNVWIGLYRRGQAWSWVDGSRRRYSAWDGDDGAAGPRCAALEDAAGFMSWDIESCSERKPFLCKYAA